MYKIKGDKMMKKKKKLLALLLVGLVFLLLGCEKAGPDTQTTDPTTEVTTEQQTTEQQATEPTTEQPTTEVTTEPVTEEEPIVTLIKLKLDILAQNEPAEHHNDKSIIDNDTFKEIVALGEEALGTLELIADRSYTQIKGYEKSSDKKRQRLWAVHAIYEINPEKYDLFFPSQNDKYTVRLLADSFDSIFNHGVRYNDVWIIENATNKVIYKTDLSKAFTLGGLFYLEVAWSSDNRYAVIECQGRRSGSVMVVDLNKKSDIYLPCVEEVIDHVFPGKDVDSVIVAMRSWFTFESWESNNVVKISFSVGMLEEEKMLFGFYTYDFEKRKILNLEYDFG